MEVFTSHTLQEVARYLKFRTSYTPGTPIDEFEVHKDQAVEVLLAASYLQID